MDLATGSTLSFKHNPLQEEFVFSPERRISGCGAIRSGKTVGAGARILWLAQLMPGSRFLIGRKDFNDLFNTTLKEVCSLIAASNNGDWKVPGPLVIKYDGQFNDLYLRTKGEPSILHFRHLKQVSKQLGMETSGYFIDQLEEVDEEVFAHIHSRMTWWNAERIFKFEQLYGFKPQVFEIVAVNPDPGWVRAFLFEQDDENSAYYRHPVDRFKIFTMTTEQNRENLAPGYIEEMERTHTRAWVDRFLRGDWNIRGGAVYEDFNENIHCIRAFKLPAHWPRFISLDWGYDHPHAVYWGAVDENGTLYVYDELFGRKKVVSEVAAEIHKKTKFHTAAPRADEFGGLIAWFDPSTNQNHGTGDRTVMGEFREHKIYGLPANNSVDAGINKVAERLKFDTSPKDGTKTWKIKPKLFIFQDQCPNLIKGFKIYIWQPPNLQGISSGKPVKKDDDAVDSVRYLCMAVLESSSQGMPRVKLNEDPIGEMMLRMMLEEDRV